MAQTAVEWLAEALAMAYKIEEISIRNFTIKKLIEQAKEMQDEQMQITWNNAIDAVQKDKWDSYHNFYNDNFKTESDLTSIVKRVVNENESNSDDILNERPEKKLNVSDVSDSLTPKETLTLLMKIWERIPLGTRMSCGGMEREIPKEIRELLNKFGYKIVKK
jgi:hypothetical protein